MFMLICHHIVNLRRIDILTDLQEADSHEKETVGTNSTSKNLI